MQVTPTTTKPAVLPVNFNGIPEHLRQCGRWVLWRYRQHPDGTWYRALFTARGNRTGGTDGRGCAPYGAIQDGYEYYEKRNLTPEGIAFHLGDCFVALQLNNVFKFPHDAALPTPPPLSLSAQQPLALPAPSLPPSFPPSQNSGSIPPPASEPLTPSAIYRAQLLPWAEALVKEYATSTQINTDGLGLTLISSDLYRPPPAGTLIKPAPHYPPFNGPGLPPTAHPEGGTFAIYHTGEFLPITGHPWPAHSHRLVENRNNRLQAVVDRARTVTDIPTILWGHAGGSPAERDAQELAKARRESETHWSRDPCFFINNMAPDQIPPPTEDEPAELTRYRDQVAASNRAHNERLKKEAEQAAEKAAAEKARRKKERRRAKAAAKIPQTPEDKLRQAHQNLKHNYAHRSHIDRVIALALTEFNFGCTRSGETFLVDRYDPAAFAELFTRRSKVLRDMLSARTREVFGTMPPASAVTAAVQWLHYNAGQFEPEEIPLRVANYCFESNVAAAVPSRPSRDSAVGNAVPGVPPERNVVAAVSIRPSEPAVGSAVPSLPSADPNVAAAVPSRPNPGPQNLPPLCPSVPPPSVEPIALDLGRNDGKCIVITPQGWQPLDAPPVLFHRSRITKKLPLPQPAAGTTQPAAGTTERGGSLDQFRAFIHVDDDGWAMLRGWLIAALFPDIDHPILLLGGADAADKATTLRILSELIDPTAAAVRTPPRNIEHWLATAAGSWFLPFDNVAAIAPWFGVALSKAVQGQPFTRPKPDAEGDLAVLEFRRVIALAGDILSGIDPGVDPDSFPGDLADQLLQVDLQSIEEHLRLPESQRLEEFRRQRPQILGALLDEVAAVMRGLPEVRLAYPPKMADFAKILAALPGGSDVAAAVPSRPSGVPLAIADASQTSGAAKPKNAAPPIEEQKPAPSNTSQHTEEGAPQDPPPLGLSASPPSPSPLAPAASSLKTEDAKPDNEDDKRPFEDDKNGREDDKNAIQDDKDDKNATPLKIYLRQIKHLASDLLESDPVAAAVVEFTQSRQTWQGTATELLAALTPSAVAYRWPKSHNHLSRRLRRLASTLQTIGIAVDFPREGGFNRTRQILLGRSGALRR